MWVYGDWLTFGRSLKWSLEELQFWVSSSWWVLLPHYQTQTLRSVNLAWATVLLYCIFKGNTLSSSAVISGMSAYISIFSITDIICLTEREKPIIPCGIAAWLHNHFDIVNALQREYNPRGKTNQHLTPAWASVSFLQSAPHTTSAGHQCPTTTSFVFSSLSFWCFFWGMAAQSHWILRWRRKQVLTREKKGILNYGEESEG